MSDKLVSLEAAKAAMREMNDHIRTDASDPFISRLTEIFVEAAIKRLDMLPEVER